MKIENFFWKEFFLYGKYHALYYADGTLFFQIPMADFTQEIKRLQKLSCISLSPKEEEKFGQQLTDIIDFLGKLPDTNTTTAQGHTTEKLTLRTMQQQEESLDTKQLLQNVHHPIINNSIVIKSALS